MQIIKTDIPNLLVLKPRVFEDERGCFFESYNKKTLLNLGIDIDFVQDNQSVSTYGVLRGLHFQSGEFAQTKLVRTVHGRILDVAVDLREGSATYGAHFSIELSDENKLQLLVPKGFAHGFVVLSEKAEVLYKCDEYYNQPSEGGVRYDDPTLNISWGIPHEDMVINEKDLLLPYL